MRFTTLIGLLLLVGIFLVDLGPNISLIVDPLACTFVVVGTLGLVLTSFSLREIRLAIAIGLGAWFTTRQNSVSDIQAAEIFYRHVAIYASDWLGRGNIWIGNYAGRWHLRNRSHLATWPPSLHLDGALWPLYRVHRLHANSYTITIRDTVVKKGKELKELVALQIRIGLS